MGLFKKKEEVPKIPTSASLPSLIPNRGDPIKKDLPGIPELPSFPTSTKNENLNQEIVKSAVSDMPSPDEKEIYSRPLAHKNEETIKPILPPKPLVQNPEPKVQESAIPELPKPRPQESHLEPVKTKPVTSIKDASKRNEPIFVRIDKFQIAQKTFKEIQSKVGEVELTLKKLKELKSQEDKEIESWTEETKNIKSKLMEIDGDIFSQL